jgi:hypothetical protein
MFPASSLMSYAVCCSPHKLSAGFFTPRAEITNGRAAMLGFAVLAALEYKAGVPFF